MSKIEDLALKAYPVVMTTLIPADEEHPLIEQDCNKFKRAAFVEGYHQAEKDLELGWEDFEIIHKITYDESRNVSLNKGGETSKKEFYQEVLKRFKDFKERKEEP